MIQMNKRPRKPVKIGPMKPAAIPMTVGHRHVAELGFEGNKRITRGWSKGKIDVRC